MFFQIKILQFIGQQKKKKNLKLKKICLKKTPKKNTDESTGAASTEPGALLSSKQWLTIQVPNSYLAGNWPLRFASLDGRCENLAVAGRTGFALYSLVTRRWKLFGNETQEKDFVVAGGLLWWKQQLIMGCYSVIADRDEIRVYPRDVPRLDNSFCSVTQVTGQMLLLNLMRDNLLVYTSDCHISLFRLEQRESFNGPAAASLERTQEIDVSTLGLHPACLVAATLTSLSTEPHRVQAQESMQQVIFVFDLFGGNCIVVRHHRGIIF